ncbi:MAG TPA: DUF5677 domain-containing protein [Candidatus Dormibacteraeota bacterium]|nr:DUF5677 domain-containing protein [Candidatus Dormibacteraeota bacterium]
MPDEFDELTQERFEEMLGPPVSVDGIDQETDDGRIDGIVFELYKEAACVVSVTAHLLDDSASAKGGLSRNQAICAGLLVRITKLMLVVTQLGATGNRSEPVMVLSRCIMESAVNLEFLAHKNEDRFYDQFVKLSLGPERELYDQIRGNIVARNGVMLPIESRILSRIENLCRVSGVKITDVDRKPGDWGGGVRERLKALGKEHRYVSMQRTPSHAVHGTWVDLFTSHLEYNATTATFAPDTTFAVVDSRALGPIARLVLEAVCGYLDKFFAHTTPYGVIKARLDDLQARLWIADNMHEKLYGAKWQKAHQ